MLLPEEVMKTSVIVTVGDVAVVVSGGVSLVVATVVGVAVVGGVSLVVVIVVGAAVVGGGVLLLVVIGFETGGVVGSMSTGAE